MGPAKWLLHISVSLFNTLTINPTWLLAIEWVVPDNTYNAMRPHTSGSVCPAIWCVKRTKKKATIQCQCHKCIRGDNRSWFVHCAARISEFSIGIDHTRIGVRGPLHRQIKNGIDQLLSNTYIDCLLLSLVSGRTISCLWARSMFIT